MLTFSTDLDLLPRGGVGTYRLRIGSSGSLPEVPLNRDVIADPGDSFDTANTVLGTLSTTGRTSQIISSAIDPKVYSFIFPGGDTDPGNRQIEIEQHLHAARDQFAGISQLSYNFQRNYGSDPFGNQLTNLITEAQKERAREVFELYSHYLGIDFVETDSSGFTIVTGDLRALDPNILTGVGGVAGLAGGATAIMDQAENWNDVAGGSWFQVAMHEIGHLLGLGHTYDLPPLTIMGSGEDGSTATGVEPDFPGDADIVHGQYLYRPESIDIDLYRFEIGAGKTGRLSAEVIAERQANASRLDSVIRLYRQEGNTRRLIAQNDDYFSDDSFLSLDLTAGTYFIGVSSKGNDAYDPTITGTGFGGTSQGSYQLRMDFRPVETTTLVDATGVRFDGDNDGQAGGNYNFWFRAAPASQTLFVNKAAAAGGTGTTAAPFRNIRDAIAAATPGKTIRIVGNGGADGNLSTPQDNLAYEIGFDTLNQSLTDGSTLEVPKGVTVMIDGGAVLKLRRALIGVGSSSQSVDRSGGALQVLGTPGRNVVFTSWMDESIGTDTTGGPTSPRPGDWGGIAFRNTADRTQARFTYQNEGIFLNYVANADLRYGGGNVRVDSVTQIVNSIYIDGEQPTIVNNRISNASDSAISANPDAFEEMTFHAPRFQVGADPFASDYDRVGPEIHGNTLLGNSTNGLFVRVVTAAGSLPQKLTVSGRFDDTDIVHVIAQNLEILGTPGGPVLDQTAPSVSIVTLSAVSGGLLPAGSYNYRLVMTDENGLEGPASAVTLTRTTTATGSIELRQLPAATGAYRGRRLYRSNSAGDYVLVAELDRSSTSFLDVGGNLGRTLDARSTRERARTNGRLAIDGGTIVKLEGSRIEAEFGSTFIAEGTAEHPVIFTSRLDDRFGAGGTFDTNNDDAQATEGVPRPGNWGGIYLGHLSSGSLDHTLITFAGGIVPTGSNFAGFNPIEIHQAEARLRNNVFEQNAAGVGGTATADRAGLFPNAPGTIFVRGAQPVILDNDFRLNQSAGISINVNALNSALVADPGRATGLADVQLSYQDNQGALVRNNRFGGNTINGMVVRGETLTTQSVWDDTDIVHVLQNEVFIPDFQHYGGLRLESSSTASLVVKLQGANAGITANGYPLDIDDRIGGSLQIIGQPGQPVVLTSLTDDSVGAGLGLTGLPLRDTDNDGIRPQEQVLPGTWKGIAIQQYAHDRNVRVHVENEKADAASADSNGTVSAAFSNAEYLGVIAPTGHAGDENLRLGFEVHGLIDSPADVDIYSFVATAGTGVWIDIDRTSQSLNSIVELLDADGRIVAISDNVSDAVSLDPGNAIVRRLQYSAAAAQAPDANISQDLYTLNAYDAGFRVLLPGSAGSQQTYFVRVRSRAAGPFATAVGGITSGVYQLQVRTQETDEVPGSQVTYADVRYAQTGISVTGQPAHSPLVGESSETETGTGVSNVTIGNLMNTDRGALYLAGRLGSVTGDRESATSYDVDFWEFEVRYDKTQTIGGVSNTRPHVPVTIDLDFADGFSRANVTVAVYDSNNRLILIGRDSNISDDQPKPLSDSDIADLGRGSNGKLDPFIGPVELLTGRYKLAIFPNDIAPEVLNQYWEVNPTQSLVRLEPINSVQRIAEERFAEELFSTRSTASLPIVDLFSTTNGTLDSKHTTPFNLGDVTLFVTTQGGTKDNDRTTVSTVDALTGGYETLVGSFAAGVGDIAMRADGQLHSFSTSTFNTANADGNTGNYLRINTGTAETTVIGDDGIVTNLGTITPGTPPTLAAALHDVGIQFNAMTYTGTQGNTLFAIGNRSTLLPKAGQTGSVQAQYSNNILYRFSTTTGAVNGNGADRTDAAIAFDGAGTTQREIGRVNTSVPGGLGGNVTGMTFLNGVFYVVDDRGGLYSVSPSDASTTFIARIGGPGAVSFAGLTAGPDEAEGGRFQSTLFGISNSGRLYAFDLTGAPRSIFANGNSSIQISGVSNVTGLAFSTLDYNLWQTTTNRGSTSAEDDGHGIDVAPYDDSVPMDQPGGTSLYFGNQRTGDSAGNQNTGDANTPSSERIRNVNFPGGAHGSVVSNGFSLEGYSASDKPALYFNYFLETEGTNFDYDTDLPTLMRDSFRVYVADETGNWNLLVTNDSTQYNNRFDEYDYGPDGGFTNNPSGQPFPDVVEAFDNTGKWRQARVDLSNFAGRANLKLRFDFSTAGSMQLGDPNAGGFELYAVPGAEIKDGDSITVGNQRFEFDMGAHLTIPSGGTLVGQTFTVNGTTFRYTTTPVSPTDIAVGLNETAATMASRTAAAITAVLSGAASPVRAIADGNRVTLEGAISVVLPIGSPLQTSGTTGVTAGSIRIPVRSNMSDSEVAVQIRRALASVFGAGDEDNIRGHQNLIQIYGRSVQNPGPLGFAADLPGDDFGAFNAGYVNGIANRPGSLRGINNAVEGVYVDDIIIGFAERGEMVTNASATDQFIINDDVYNPNYEGRGFVGFQYNGIADGAYDVEIRRATDYALSRKAHPLNVLYRTIDTNDREAVGIAVSVPTAAQIPNNSTFVLSDGWSDITFQFIDSASGNPVVNDGGVPIFFDSRIANAGTYLDGAEQMAALIRNAINSPTVQAVLKVQAMPSNTSGANSRTLHLTGNAILTPDAQLATVLDIQVYHLLTDPFNSVYRPELNGDQNQSRDQGQIIVQSTTVRNSLNFGIDVDASVRGGLNPTPHPGSVRNTQELNEDRLTTGVVVMNNVIVNNSAGGVRFSGDSETSPLAAVPYGRIVNNTIVGIGSGTGILVNESAAPTILNNIVADFGTGINVDGSSIAAGTTIGTTLYRGNGVSAATGPIGLGSYPIVLGASDALFVNQSAGNYYPAPQSQAVDSSLNSLGDRELLIRIRDSLGLGISTILAPEFDAYGQLRGDDETVSTPASQGANVFIDRGAIDRVDFFRPSASLVVPEDQSSVDQDPAIGIVWIDKPESVREFRIRLSDEGIGVEDARVNAAQFVLRQDDRILEEGVDYIFSYNSVTDEAVFSSATVFPFETRYTIEIDNDGVNATDTIEGVRDLAGNYLLGNQNDGSSKFFLLVTDGVNDAPINSLPASVSVPEDGSLTFNTANGNLISVSDADLHLGNNTIKVTLTATNGVMSLSRTTGLTFSLGDGQSDAVVAFSGNISDVNAALNGLRFVPGTDFFGQATIRMVSDDLGQLGGPDRSSKLDDDTIRITVTPSNDLPTLNSISGLTIPEDSGQQTVNLAGITAGAGGEVQPLRVTATSSNTGVIPNPTVTYVSPGNTGSLRFTPVPNGSGVVTITVTVEDGGLDGNLNTAGDNATTTRTFTVTVTPSNDLPTVNPISNLTIPEDSGVRTINLSGISAGPLETQPLRITATSSNTLVIPVPTVTYTSPNATGTLTFTPAANAFGVSTITVTVEDGGIDGNLATAADNGVTTRSFVVTVTSVNDVPVAASGNYLVDEGDGFTLNAGPSFDVDEPTGDILTYSWDLNGDGTYDINSGTATTAVVTWAQLTQFGITAPSVRQIRLRVTDASNASSTVLVQLSTLIVDYGDAPNTYGTLKANNGAAHTINGVLFLGSSIDKEANGQPSTTATGDGADEDGVTLTSTIEASPTLDLPSLMTVVSSAAGKLDAWLDFNNNGVFEAGEHLNDGLSYSVVGGANRLSFIVPRGTTVGSRMMRFRLSSTGGLAPTGRAADGEVEDYRVSIQALQVPVTPGITLPIDSLPNDGLIPETSDLSPLIEWTQSNANFFYNVDVRNSANVSVFSRTGLTTTSVLVDRNLVAGVYTVRLTALNRGNVAAPVATYSFRVVPIAVTAPATDVGTLRPQITWTAVAGTKSYFVEVTSVLTGNIVHSATILTSGVTPPALPNQYTLPVNLPLGSYRVRVRATDAADLPGDFSAIRTFNVRAATTVTGPVGSIDVRRPTITWNAIPGAVSYRVQLDNMTDNVSVLNPVSGITSTSWIVPVDLKLAEYRVRVTGFTANGIASFESAPWTFRVTPATTTLTPLGRLPDSTPTFGWNVIAGADQYELIVRNKRYDSTAVVISQLSLNTTSFTQPTNLPLGRYTYQIRGINNPAVAGQAKIFSAYSPVYEFVITAPPVITQPQDATFSTRPVFQWTNPLGSEKNDLVVTQVGVPGTFLAVNGITGTSLTSTKDFGVGTYVVQVRTYSRTDNPATAADEREVSDWSLPRTFRVTTAPAIIGPSGRTADSTPTLTWQAVLGAQSYEVSINSDTFGIMDVVTASGLRSLSYTVTAGLPIGRYSWKVRAAGPSGVMSAYSTIGRFEIVAPPSFTSVITQTLDSTPTLSWTSLAGMLKGNPAGAASYELVIYDTRADNSVIREAFRRTGILGTSFTVPTALTVGKHRAIVKATTFGLPGATGAPTVTDDSAPLDFYVITDRPVVAAIGTTTDTTPTISWTPVNGATRYNLRITTGTTPDSGIVRQANAVNGLSYTVPTALTRGTYRVWVQAISSTTGVAGAWSSVVTMVIADADSSDQSGSGRIDDVTTTTSGQSSEFILTAHLDTAVSMIPATIVTGDRLESSDLHRSVRELSGAALTAEVDGTASDKELDVTSGELLTQKDAVLSDWDSEAWWDVPSSEPSVAADDTSQILPMTTDVVAPSQAEPSKSDDSVVTASAGGFLGMILAWTHGSVRNRFRRSAGVKNETDTE